jgi:hypothetical protein
MSDNSATAKHLSFEWDAKGERLEIHGNDKGLAALVGVLELLIAKSENDHVHLMTAEWGGNTLSSDRQNSDAKLINHVKILRWK